MSGLSEEGKRDQPDEAEGRKVPGGVGEMVRLVGSHHKEDGELTKVQAEETHDQIRPFK